MSYAPVTLNYPGGSKVVLSRDGDIVTAKITPPPTTSLFQEPPLEIPSDFDPYGFLSAMSFVSADYTAPGAYGLVIDEIGGLGPKGIGVTAYSAGTYQPFEARWAAEPGAQSQIEDSILHDVKQMVGQEWDDTTYDLDIKTHINSVFLDLQQIGVGPSSGYEISGASDKWDAYLVGNKNLNAVKSYIYIRVRLLFDPPTNSFLVESLQKQIDKLEWRLMVEMDPPVPPSPLGEINE